jgi:hypothetical protein
MNTSLASDFDNLMDFPEEELKKWLVTFVNDNDLSSIDELQIEHKEVEDDIFSLQVKQQITIPPIKNDIDKWIKNALQQLTNPE